jgi:hypothetical protein
MSEGQPKSSKGDIESADEAEIELEPEAMSEGTRGEYRAQLKHMVEKVLKERKEGEGPVAE